MKIRFFLLFMVFAFFLSACAPKQYIKQNAALIVFRTPSFQYADLGFIYENKEETKVEIYSNAQPLMTLEISKKTICMSLLECMSKETFNQKVLSAYYPQDTLEHIFQGKSIFGQTGLKKKSNGFTQKIVSGAKYDIFYSVLNNEIIFRDTINQILIKVKKQ
ncbi:MAG: hypothetical protein QG564_1627 [Campylobacterota bacterium]|nr:hypothetical protein [Campylobacterota bacterium]